MGPGSPPLLPLGSPRGSSPKGAQGGPGWAVGMVPSPLHLSGSDPSSHDHSHQGGGFGASLHWACGWASAVLPPHAADEDTYREVKQGRDLYLGLSGPGAVT